MATCSNCGATLRRGAKFCSTCGEPVRRAAAARQKQIFCSNCSAELPDYAQFCPKCGQEVRTNVAVAEMPYRTSRPEIPTMAGKYDGYSKILGVLGIFLAGWILGPLAIYYGAKARSLDERKGLVGMVLGIVGLILWIVATVILVYANIRYYNY
jgi:RNA polymerase subunit RPABC4/transcription elongation factor Spt4